MPLEHYCLRWAPWRVVCGAFEYLLVILPCSGCIVGTIYAYMAPWLLLNCSWGLESAVNLVESVLRVSKASQGAQRRVIESL